MENKRKERGMINIEERLKILKDKHPYAFQTTIAYTMNSKHGDKWVCEIDYAQDNMGVFAQMRGSASTPEAAMDLIENADLGEMEGAEGLTIYGQAEINYINEFGAIPKDYDDYKESDKWRRNWTDEARKRREAKRNQK